MVACLSGVWMTAGSILMVDLGEVDGWLGCLLSTVPRNWELGLGRRSVVTSGPKEKPGMRVLSWVNDRKWNWRTFCHTERHIRPPSAVVKTSNIPHPPHPNYICHTDTRLTGGQKVNSFSLPLSFPLVQKNSQMVSQNRTCDHPRSRQTTK